MRVAGIDSDSKGSIAVIDTQARTVTIYYIPSELRQLKTSKTRRAHILKRKIAGYCDEMLQTPIDAIYIEEQRGLPDQDSASTFTFGCIYCCILQAVESAAVHNGRDPKIVDVHSTVWKDALRVTADKKTALALATKVFPKIAPAWALVSYYTSAAEATLIAFYGLVKEAPRGSVNVNDFKDFTLVLKTPHVPGSHK